MTYRQWGKRLLDLMLSLPLLTILMPIYGIIALWTWAKMGSPVLFRQIRPGIFEKAFTIFKFRTMVESEPIECGCISDSERLTPFGRNLRNLSLDELPELFNVLIGDMSLVGPRPLLMEYLDLYSPEQARRHEVKPGITGWAQVNGRNAITWEEKFSLDVWYVDHLSFWLDLKIIAMTIWKIVRREGINQSGQATMEKFHGTGGEHGG